MRQPNDQIKAIIVQELPRLRRFAYSLTGSMADADDLVQNVVVRVLNAGIPDPDNAIAWMLRICKNRWIDEIRSRSAQTKAMDTIKLDAQAANEADKQVHDQMDLERVVKAMDTLSDNQRVALSLVAIEGMSYSEAAKVLEVPIGTIMSRVARARENLHNVMHSESGDIVK